MYSTHPIVDHHHIQLTPISKSNLFSLKVYRKIQEQLSPFCCKIIVKVIGCKISYMIYASQRRPPLRRSPQRRPPQRRPPQRRRPRRRRPQRL